MKIMTLKSSLAIGGKKEKEDASMTSIEKKNQEKILLTCMALEFFRSCTRKKKLMF